MNEIQYAFEIRIQNTKIQKHKNTKHEITMYVELKTNMIVDAQRATNYLSFEHIFYV